MPILYQYTLILLIFNIIVAVVAVVAVIRKVKENRGFWVQQGATTGATSATHFITLK